jgi:predicted MFS family arabinose efflux permease
MAKAGRDPLRSNRDFRLLWIGQTVSVLGSRISSIAFPLLVLAVWHSPVRAGIVGFASTIPLLLLQIPAGAFVDRWNRKRTMIWSDVVRAAALASVAVALWMEDLTFAHLVVVAFVDGALFVFYNLAQNAAIPKVVTAEQLPTALAQNEAGTRGSALIGQPLGGVLFAIGRALPFVADAVSFAVSILTLAAIRTPFRKDLPSEREPIVREVVEGFRWLWSQPFIRATSLLVAGANMVYQALLLVAVVAATRRGASPGEVGLVMSFIGIGGLVGSFVAPWAQRHFSTRAIVLGVNWTWVAMIPLIALPLHWFAIGAAIGSMVLVGPTWNVLVSTYELSLIPDRLLGRVTSVILMLAWGAIPLGALAAGVLLEWLPLPTAVLSLAGLMAVVAFAATVTPAVRHAPPLPQPTPVRPQETVTV